MLQTQFLKLINNTSSLNKETQTANLSKPQNSQNEFKVQSRIHFVDPEFLTVKNKSVFAQMHSALSSLLDTSVRYCTVFLFNNYINITSLYNDLKSK